MNPIVDAVSGVFSGIVKPILDKWVPDANERIAAEQAIMAAGMSLVAAQTEINKVEAASTSRFVSGWRPAIGWICAISLAYSLIGYSLLNWAFAMASLHTSTVFVPLPQPDTSIVMELLLGMLGLGGLRTFEKLKGVSV